MAGLMVLLRDRVTVASRVVHLAATTAGTTAAMKVEHLAAPMAA